MKNLFILLFFLANASLSMAQKFFYIDTENGNTSGAYIKEQLLKASQYVTTSLLESEYIIQAEMNTQAKCNMPAFKITVKDTITSKTIFEAEENYPASVANVSPQTASAIAMQTLISKNIKEIILCAKQESFQKMMLLIGLKKDKT